MLHSCFVYIMGVKAYVLWKIKYTENMTHTRRLHLNVYTSVTRRPNPELRRWLNFGRLKDSFQVRFRVVVDHEVLPPLKFTVIKTNRPATCDTSAPRSYGDTRGDPTFDVNRNHSSEVQPFNSTPLTVENLCVFCYEASATTSLLRGSRPECRTSECRMRPRNAEPRDAEPIGPECRMV